MIILLNFHTMCYNRRSIKKHFCPFYNTSLPIAFCCPQNRDIIFYYTYSGQIYQLYKNKWINVLIYCQRWWNRNHLREEVKKKWKKKHRSNIIVDTIERYNGIHTQQCDASCSFSSGSHSNFPSQLESHNCGCQLPIINKNHLYLFNSILFGCLVFFMIIMFLILRIGIRLEMNNKIYNFFVRFFCSILFTFDAVYSKISSFFLASNELFFKHQIYIKGHDKCPFCLHVVRCLSVLYKCEFFYYTEQWT